MRLILSLLLLTSFSGSVNFADEASNSQPAPEQLSPVSAAGARIQAKLLHEALRGTLEVMHRDFFDDDAPESIPSASMEDVFDELDRRFGVSVKWLNVETDVLNVDHQPEGQFEQAAAKAIAGGRTEFENVTQDRFQYVGRIRLASQCLKCHVKYRTDTKDRSAGLFISIPLKN